MWTTANRPKYKRDNLRYPSDLTGEEWAHIEALIPPAKHGGRKRKVDVREVVNKVDDDCLKELRWMYDRRARSPTHSSRSARSSAVKLPLGQDFSYRGFEAGMIAGNGILNAR